MSLLLLIDGYNIAHPIAPSVNAAPGWLQQQRDVLLRDLTNHLSASVRSRTCVVFDAAEPPRDQADRYDHQGIDVRFAVDHVSADELIQEIIRAHHTPKRLMVVSSDHQVQIAARRRGAQHCDSEPWIDDLTDGKPRLAVAIDEESSAGGAGQGGPPKPPPIDPDEVARWMREFGFDD